MFEERHTSRNVVKPSGNSRDRRLYLHFARFSVLTLRASTRCDLRLANSTSSVRSLFFFFFIFLDQELSQFPTLLGWVNSRVTQSHFATRCMHLCSLSAVCLCDTSFTLSDISCWTLADPALITVHHDQLALQRNVNLYPPMLIDLELVSRFEDVGHRERESLFCLSLP